MLFSGKLRHRVVIQRQVETQDSTNGVVIVSWQDVDTVWADISPISGREFITASAEMSDVTTRITIRYRADVTAKMRAYHPAKNKYYNIEGVLSDKDSGLEYLTLPCSEGLRYKQGDPAAVALVNLQLPTIGGTPEVGEVIEVTDGIWANDPVSFSYQWRRADNSPISGATNDTYLLTVSELGISVYCTVTATNSAGSVPVNTASFGPISA